jgi:uncharacterized protein (TIGR02246 family)
MRIFYIFVALLFAAPGALAQSDADRAAINGALANWLAGWERKDVDLAVTDYSEDADWTNAFGMTRRGREEIREQLEIVFALDFVMAGDTVYAPPEMRFLDENMALVRTRSSREGQLSPDGESLGVRRTKHLRVFEKRDGR